MSKSINHRHSSFRTTLTGALLSGVMALGGCGTEGIDDAQAAQAVSQGQHALGVTGVWRANMAVTIVAAKDSVAKKITYNFEVENLGDDDARGVVLSAHVPAGLTISSLNKGAFDTCTPITTGAGLIYVQCNVAAHPVTLPVRAKAKLTVVVNNPTNAAAEASAQVFNNTPDPIVSNNFAQISTP